LKIEVISSKKEYSFKIRGKRSKLFPLKEKEIEVIVLYFISGWQ